MGTPRFDINTNNVINEYLSGKSVKQLASDFGCSRQVIYRVLRNANIIPRNRSESMFLRMAQTSKEERQRLTSAAHQAKKGYINSPETRHKMALARNKRIGIFEADFINRLVASGINVTPQEPFLAYNLDIGCGNVAVEIHTQTCSPLSKNHIKKLMECTKAGKAMVYVWLDPRCGRSPSDLCYNEVVSLVKLASSDPSFSGKYWVVRRTGEIYACGTFNSD